MKLPTSSDALPTSSNSDSGANCNLETQTPERALRERTCHAEMLMGPPATLQGPVDPLRQCLHTPM